MTRILLVDDNKQIQAIIKDYLNNAGMHVVLANDGLEALALFENEEFDLVLLDIMMPRLDGFSVCQKIRATSNIPIIMITARGEDYDKIMGLEIGADDYIVKPFSPGEILARIKALLRRVDSSNTTKKTILVFENLKIDISKYEVIVNKVKIALTKKEVEILWFLANNSSQVFSRDQLLEKIWGFDYDGDIRNVDTHIKRLRSKLTVQEHPTWDIETVWGVGYKFEKSEH